MSHFPIFADSKLHVNERSIGSGCYSSKVFNVHLDCAQLVLVGRWVGR